MGIACWWQRWARRLGTAWHFSGSYLQRRHGRTWRGLVGLWADYGALQRHRHLYVIYARWPCEECIEEHLDDEVCHFDVHHLASSQQRAVAWLRMHAGRLPAGACWEVWEEAVDSYAPFERADDEGDFWHYGRDGQALSIAAVDALMGYADVEAAVM